MITSAADAVERVLWIGYATHAEAVAKGIFVPEEPWTYDLAINFGKPFKDIVYTVPFGKVDVDMRYTDEIQYRERRQIFLGVPRTLRFFLEIPSAIRFLSRCAREHRPQVVQICGPHLPAVLVWLVPRLWRVPKVCFIEAFWEQILKDQDYLPRAARRILPRWYGLVYRIFDAYVGTPSLQPAYYIEKGMKQSKIHPWVQAIDLDRIASLDPAGAPEAVLKAPGPRIATVGRLHPEKLSLHALETFLELASSGFPGSLVFIGDGPLRQDITERARAAGLGDRVIITGFLPYPTAIRATKACQYYLATMQGAALIEAMAVGLPIVAYDHETHAAMIEHDVTGILVPSEQPPAAAAALAALIADPERAARLGDAAAAHIRRRFNPPSVAAILADPLRAVARRAAA